VAYFWVLEEQPPGDKLPTARQHIPVLPNFLCFYEGSGGGD